ncbi:unnamed protein product [Schistocephalus solidus]|uniref:Glycosyltransferase-like protein LARGE1 n=1 Tax=Schistocephalus solidus TaxID=70667 RepID=A0A183SFQ5_SCHSO|nr:unnamed protein product [Schistocephalus solidus]
MSGVSSEGIARHIIFLDLDLVMTCNLKDLWKYFDEFSDDEVIGLIENQSDWYLQTRSPARWPAIGRGFNTGVALMDVHKMRRHAWGDHWRNVTKKTLRRLNYTSLADQVSKDFVSQRPEDSQRLHEIAFVFLSKDIVNAALFHDNRRVKRLPCKWNVQLTDSVDYASCLRENELDDKFKDAFYEKACILHWNKPIKPSDKVFSGHDAELQMLQDPNVLGARVNSLHRLEEVVVHWDGPISLALYVTDKEVLLLMEYLQSIPTLSNRQDLFVHLIFKEGDDDLEDERQNGRNNKMKVDKSSLTKLSPGKDSRPVAYVIPAFETFFTQIHFPANKSELLNQINAGVVKPFRIDVWPTGHQATNYTHWYNSSIPYEVSRKVKWEADFEPYVVVKRSAAKFDTRFLGFGWNKVAYAMLLDTLGYRFVVLPEVFVIHLPHSPSMEVSRFRNSPFFRYVKNSSPT